MAPRRRPAEAGPATPTSGAGPGRPEPQQRSLFDDGPAGPVPIQAPEPARLPTNGPRFGHPEAAREVVLDGVRVAFALRRVRRRSIGFVVGPQGLAVSVPRWVPLADVDTALRARAGWILRKLTEQEARARRLAQARVDWRDGATLPFLGHTLRIVIDPRSPGAVLHTEAVDCGPPDGPRLHVGLPRSAEPAQLRDAVQSWLQRQARRVFEERCAHYAPRLGVRVRRLALSSATTRWGSASADGSIRLNWRLVHFGLPVIDYVVAHELAHLREMNHSPAFWDVVRSVVPDVEGLRERLREQVLPDLG
jgi:predicted metal-dependent hydrolase